jgi:multidrug efflux pump
MTLQINIDFVTREIVTGAPSSQWWVQLSTAVAFGLTFATLLTLVMTPSLLMVGANVSSFFERRKIRKAERKLLKSHPEPAE